MGSAKISSQVFKMAQEFYLGHCHFSANPATDSTFVSISAGSGEDTLTLQAPYSGAFQIEKGGCVFVLHLFEGRVASALILNGTS